VETAKRARYGRRDLPSRLDSLDAHCPVKDQTCKHFPAVTREMTSSSPNIEWRIAGSPEARPVLADCVTLVNSSKPFLLATLWLCRLGAHTSGLISHTYGAVVNRRHFCQKCTDILRKQFPYMRSTSDSNTQSRTPIRIIDLIHLLPVDKFAERTHVVPHLGLRHCRNLDEPGAIGESGRRLATPACKNSRKNMDYSVGGSRLFPVQPFSFYNAAIPVFCFRGSSRMVFAALG
jgi:hypothetical protein